MVLKSHDGRFDEDPMIYICVCDIDEVGIQQTS